MEAKILALEEKCKECSKEKAEIKKLLHKTVEIQSKIDRQKERINESERLNISKKRFINSTKIVNYFLR